MTEEMKKKRDELAESYATNEGATIEKRKCFTVDLHIGNRQQYEYVKRYNNDSFCSFKAGFEACYQMQDEQIKKLEIELDSSRREFSILQKAANEQIEKLSSRLDNAIYFQEKAKSFISHDDDCDALTGDLEEGESCYCGLDKFAHDNYISIQYSMAALTADEGEG